MTMVTKTGLCLLGLAVWQGVAFADTPDSSTTPYEGIVLRNLFGLKPIPPPPPPPEPAKPPAPPITLNGITTILGNKRALLSFTATPKPGEPARMNSVVLAEGQREDDIEVMEIDVKAGSVRVNAFGVVSTINFKDNGAKLPTGPAPAMAANPGSPAPAPGAPNPFAPPGAGGGKTIPGRPLRLPTGGQGGTPGAANGNNPGGGSASANGVNGVNGAGNTGFGGFAQPQQGNVAPPVQPQDFARTPEEDTILTEVDRERHRGDPKYPPLPPTALTSPEDLKAIMAPGWDAPKVPRGGQPQ